MASRNSGLCTVLAFLVTVLLFVNVSICPAGQTWAKNPGNPVLEKGPPGSWDCEEIGEPAVIKDGGVYRMWYWGYDGANGCVGYATSSDGLNWTKHPSAVMDIGPPGSFDDVSATEFSVLKDGSIYKMWYTGNDDGPIGYATSSDGISWTKHPSPVLYLGSPGSWDVQEIDNPSVITDGGTFLMWYGGEDTSSKSTIGYATSPDGLSWGKYVGNPVLGPGLPGSWDQSGIDCPSVIVDGSLYKMWYDSGGQGIGYAYSDIPTSAFPGWVWMLSGGDFGYSLNEDDSVYFLSFWPVWYYNFTTGVWHSEGPVDLIFIDWPFFYESDTSTLWFVLPPESGLWVYHFCSGLWELLPRIIP